jgi:hypothetical protein
VVVALDHFRNTLAPTYISYMEGIQSHSIVVNRPMGILSVHSMSLPCPGRFPLTLTDNWVQITPP